MVKLPALELYIGSTDAEIDRAMAWCRTLAHAVCRKASYERERPAHRVRISAMYYDMHERSTGEVARWLSGVAGLHEDGGWLSLGGVRLAQVGEDRDLRSRGASIVPRPGTERLPAVDVTYDGARAFCQAQGMDLPTEAQWERAARGPRRRQFPWGDLEPTCDRAVYGRGLSGPCPSGERVPVDQSTGDRTPEGVLNLGGNVAEWVLDRFVEGRYRACPPPCTDPIEPVTAHQQKLHVIRGGAFDSVAEQLRAARRGRASRDAALGNTGFRCAAPYGEESP